MRHSFSVRFSLAAFLLLVIGAGCQPQHLGGPQGIVKRRALGGPTKPFQAPPHGFLGVQFEPDSLVIVAATPETSAAEVGLTAGETIVSINGRPVASLAELQSILKKTKPIEDVSLEIKNVDEEIRTVSVRLVSFYDIAALQAKHGSPAEGVENPAP